MYIQRKQSFVVLVWQKMEQMLTALALPYLPYQQFWLAIGQELSSKRWLGHHSVAVVVSGLGLGSAKFEDQPV